MAVVHCLAAISAFDPMFGERVEVRVASAQLRSITGLGGQRWIPAMAEAPTLSMQLFNGDFTAPISPGGASITLALRSLTGANAWPDALRYFWPDAEVVLYAAPAGTAWPWPVKFRGRVTDFRSEAASLTLSASVDSEPFARDVLTATYAGSGGAEGGVDLKDRVRPLILGAAQNVEPVPLNVVDSIYQFSGYGPIEAVDVLYERGAAFGAVAADYATYSALQAAAVAKGTWATCLAEGLIKLGAPAYGVITADVRGHKVGATSPALTGAVIQALATLAGVVPAKLVTATLTALDAAAAYPIGLVLSGQVRFADIARELALYCNRQAGIGLDGRFFVTRPNPAATPAPAALRYSRSREERTSPPYAKTTFGAARCWRVHSVDEIATGGLTLLGIYSATTVYRTDNLVSATDGRMFVYINATPGAGNAPPVQPSTSNSHWTVFNPATYGATDAQAVDIAAALADSAQAIFDAAGAQATADGKIETFYQTSAPIASGTGDLWIDTDDANKLYRWSGSAWVAVRDAGIAQAIADASTAQSTADGKIVSFYQTSAPTAEGVGDIWVDTNDGNKFYRWSGSAWVAVRDDGAAYALLGLNSSGVVNTDKVVTASIQDGAVTTPGSAYTASTLNLTTSDQNAQSLTITTTGEPVILLYSLAYVQLTDNEPGFSSLYRDSTPLIQLDQIPVNSGDNPTTAMAYTDTPAAGTYTYYVKARLSAGASGQIGVRYRSLVALEVKK